jgi:hypothetical protein
MQAQLLEVERIDSAELAYRRAALRECIEYGDHGIDIEETPDGHEVCFNCGGAL